MKRFFLTLAGSFLVASFFLPRRSRVAVATWMDAPPEKIFPFLDRLRSWEQWARLGCGRAPGGLLYDGPETGKGARMRWRDPKGLGSLTLNGGAENHHVGFEIAILPDGPRLEGVLTLVELGEGSRVRMACWWEGDPNPLGRWGDLFLRWRLQRRFEASLEALRHLVAPEAAPALQPSTTQP